MATKTAKTRPEKASKPNTDATNCKSCPPNCADKCEQTVPKSEPALSIGETLARDAISVMTKSKDRKDHAEDFDEQNVQDFLRTCNDSGNDPISVVEQVAETYKIDLSADGRFDNTIQKDVRSLLMKVLIRFVVDAASFVGKEIVGGNSDWKAILKEYINQRLGGVFKREGRGYGPECINGHYGNKERGSLAYGAFGTDDLVLRPIACRVGYIRYPHVVPAIRL